MARDTNKSSTALKAFHVLETVAEAGDPMSASEIAAHANMERVTTYRMLRTLEEAGYVSFDETTKTYRISKRILSLAKPVLENDDRREIIAKTMKEISRRTGETCHYSEISGIETILTQRAKGSQLVAVDFKIGTRCELHATSVGKAILAFQSDEFIHDYLHMDLKSYTGKTLVQPAGLQDELFNIRKHNRSYDFEELSEGMNCVAVPIRPRTGTTEGGISISGPIHRMTRARLSELADIIQEEIAIRL